MRLVQASWWLIVIFVSVGGSLALGQDESVKIRMEKDYWRVSVSGDPVIEAQIAQDGALVELRFLRPSEIYSSGPNAHRPSFVRTGTGLPERLALGGSRGVFFLNDQPLALNKVRPDGKDAIIAESEAASLRYHFKPSELTWTAVNKTTAPLSLLMVVDPTVGVVESTGQSPRRTPTIALWDETTWYQDATTAWWKVAVTGGDRIWGPGELVGKSWEQGLFQVWEATLAPGETRRISLSVVQASDGEVSMARELVPKSAPSRRMPPLAFSVPNVPPNAEVVLYSPVDVQVFQRATQTQGAVLISGEVKTHVDHVEVRFQGESIAGKLPGTWERLPVDPLTHGFTGRVPVPAGGWYTLDVRTPHGKAHVPRVGVGEVFITCGQSNSTNYGETSDPPPITRTGRVASFGGNIWQLCEDPQPGTTDSGQGGSPWTWFGDAMVERYDVPVAVAVTGNGGAPVQHWRPGRFPFFWVMTRIHQLGPSGFRAVLWHQGESNARGTTEEYYSSLSAIIKASHTTAGWKIPWFVARVSYRNPNEATAASTRDAQQMLWDNRIALPGPDTDTLVGKDRAGIHLSLSGLEKHGKMWADKVGVYLDPVLKQAVP